MMESTRPVIITGNWKMYKTNKEAASYIKELAEHLASQLPQVYLAVPFTAIKSASEQAKGTPIVVGAQNMHDATEGAFTGEISAKMLIEAGAKFVILGHSERRRYFNETNELINKKVHRAISERLQPILCVGETLDERQAGKTEEVLKIQIEECLKGVQSQEISTLILAYEPVWAIGTDVSATPEMAEEAHLFCRKCFAEMFGEEAAANLVIQYGGSVKPDNAKKLLEQPNIDGLLVGGACLSIESFVKIIKNEN